MDTCVDLVMHLLPSMMRWLLVAIAFTVVTAQNNADEKLFRNEFKVRRYFSGELTLLGDSSRLT